MGRNQGSRFRDRRHAGQVLGWRLIDAGMLERYPEPRVVLGLPRGGVPVAAQVARVLGAPLDVFLVRKLGFPGHEELAMGAIASGGVRVLNDEVITMLSIPASAIEETAREERAELERRERAYRDGRAAAEVSGRVVLLVDDGLATGSTMKAAVQAVRARAPARIVVAVPVGAPQSCAELAAIADEVVCARQPERFAAVGQWYADFEQTSDAEVRALLRERAGVRQEVP
jgi:predicted phosphoribosyltransferase